MRTASHDGKLILGRAKSATRNMVEIRLPSRRWFSAPAGAGTGPGSAEAAGVPPPMDNTFLCVDCYRTVGSPRAHDRLIRPASLLLGVLGSLVGQHVAQTGAGIADDAARFAPLLRTAVVPYMCAVNAASRIASSA